MSTIETNKHSEEIKNALKNFIIGEYEESVVGRLRVSSILYDFKVHTDANCGVPIALLALWMQEWNYKIVKDDNNLSYAYVQVRGTVLPLKSIVKDFLFKHYGISKKNYINTRSVYRHFVSQYVEKEYLPENTLIDWMKEWGLKITESKSRKNSNVAMVNLYLRPKNLIDAPRRAKRYNEDTWVEPPEEW